MTQPTIPPRSAIPAEHTWNAASVYESEQAWEADFRQLLDGLPALRQHEGRLGEDPARLLRALQAIDDAQRRANLILVYAGLSHEVDTALPAADSMYSRARGLNAQVMAAVAYRNPELLTIGLGKLREWMQAEPRLAVYAHFFEDLFRKQAYVRSAEVEAVLGMLADPFFGPQSNHGMLTNADFKFAPATASDGSQTPVAQGTIDKILASPDRETRRTGWESYCDTYLAFKNTLASNLATSVKQNIFQMRVRGHASSLAGALSEDNIPAEVFRNLIGVFQRNLPTWHRYWEVRRRALGVEQLHTYDIWAPLTPHPARVAYPQAVDWICDGLAPLGEAYVQAMRRGCLEERWVDIYPNQGKTDGAFSWGTQGMHPFIVMNYDDEVVSLGTLAHELGHSMHSYLTWQTQPYIYSNYSLFAAEVASNFHQAMVRAHLLRTQADRDLQIGVLEEAMANFHRYFFIMPTLARFELEIHQRVERNEGLTAEDMLGRMTELFAEGYGGRVHVDPERVGITWATFGHLYTDYYVYQYATGIAGAHALARRILDGVPGAAEAYLGFLKAGSSQYPLEALRQAGVDLSRPEPVEAGFQALSETIDWLEQLLLQEDRKEKK